MVNTMALFHKVIQSFNDIMEEKFLKFTEIFERISLSFGSQSIRIANAEQRVPDVEDIVTSLEGRLLRQRKKLS